MLFSCKLLPLPIIVEIGGEMKQILIMAICFSITINLNANAGVVKKCEEGTKKGVDTAVGGTKKGVRTAVGGTKKGVKTAVNGTKKGFRSTIHGIKKVF